MKKIKKLNLNKISIVSLKNSQILKGGNTLNDDKYTDFCTDTNIEDTCKSTGATRSAGSDGGETFGYIPPHTQTCSAVFTECELADI
ncbi:hypothetical protein [uncultured Kordia sp.]|uniref:hypothetical protein n=1 Tax=uncultured Kordia sp. TaxID=507699 RepID=UPI00260600A8|nr:hypothetical protein [uncultured Kordia sp.]